MVGPKGFALSHLFASSESSVLMQKSVSVTRKIDLYLSEKSCVRNDLGGEAWDVQLSGSVYLACKRSPSIPRTKQTQIYHFFKMEEKI